MAIVAPEVLGIRALLIAAAYAVYITVVAVGVVLVSAVRSTSRSALTSLVMLWILLCIVLPRAAQTLGVMLVPTPSKSQFDATLERELAAAGDSHNPNDPHFAELRQSTLERYGVTDVKQLPINYGALVMQEAEKISSDIFRRHYGGLLRTFEQQNRIAAWGAAINPYLAIRNLSMGLAGSDLSQYVQFQWQAEDFRYTMVQKLNDLHLKEISHENDRSQRLKQERWREFADFDFRRASVADVRAEHWPAAFCLAVCLAALAFACSRVSV
jgi:ABC-2 type transport system permease protein